MNGRVAVAMAAGALSLLAACGSPASSHASSPARPVISAAAACSDFSKWSALTNGGHTGFASPPAILDLHRAVQEAPSGTLYEGISSVWDDVEKANFLGVPALSFYVASYCASVNPNG